MTNPVVIQGYPFPFLSEESAVSEHLAPLRGRAIFPLLWCRPRRCTCLPSALKQPPSLRRGLAASVTAS